MSSSSSLLGDGWRQVESFNDTADDEDEYETEEEVEYVTLDLGVQPANAGPLEVSSYRLIGLDTPTPYLQLGSTIFKGTHQTLLGTEILFRQPETRSQQKDALLQPLPPNPTRRRIRFQEVHLRPKGSGSYPEDEDPATESIESVLQRVNARQFASTSFAAAQPAPGPSTSAPSAGGTLRFSKTNDVLASLAGTSRSRGRPRGSRSRGRQLAALSSTSRTARQAPPALSAETTPVSFVADAEMANAPARGSRSRGRPRGTRATRPRARGGRGRGRGATTVNVDEGEGEDDPSGLDDEDRAALDGLVAMPSAMDEDEDD